MSSAIHIPQPLRRRVLIELGCLGATTVLFLGLFPRRPMAVDAGLALLALTLLAVDWRHTRDVVWGLFPPAEVAHPQRTAWRLAAAVTLPLVGAFLVVGLVSGYRSGGWEGAAARLLRPGLPGAVAVYFLWALLQQTLFQVFLQGRLRVLTSRPVALLATGLTYALVHLPDPRLVAVTAVAGIFWAWLYDRYRSLPPLALSHATLGACFYYWVYGRELLDFWQRLRSG